jgi:hypothetical protein
LGIALVFIVGVGGVSVHRLEDRQEIGLHCDQSELGKAVNLGRGTGIFCIVVERSFFFHIFLIFFMIFFHIFF